MFGGGRVFGSSDFVLEILIFFPFFPGSGLPTLFVGSDAKSIRALGVLLVEFNSLAKVYLSKVFN